MQKVNFKNGQAPYINDTNLNQLQDNMEEAINELDPSMIENEATEVNDEDLLLVVQNGVKKKVPAGKVGTGGGATGDTLPVRSKSGI